MLKFVIPAAILAWATAICAAFSFYYLGRIVAAAIGVFV